MIKRKFTPEEDSKICELVNKYGARNWELIAREIPGRNSRQCRDRYQNYLIPGFFNGQWTKEEDELLYKKINQMGHQWTKMMKFFPGRTANCIKNRWNYFVCKLNQQVYFNNVMPNYLNQQIIISNGQLNKSNYNYQNLEFLTLPNLNDQSKPVEEKIIRVNEGTQTKDSCMLGINFLLI